jgi:acyl carrier protein
VTPAEIAQEEISAVYPQVAQIMADALGCDVEHVGLGVSLIEGLNAESIDFLDIIFHLERTFKVRIPRGKIVEDARGDLPEAAFEQKGHLTEAGLEHLRKFLSEVPADRFRSPMKVADIPQLTPGRRSAEVVLALRAAGRRFAGLRV